MMSVGGSRIKERQMVKKNHSRKNLHHLPTSPYTHTYTYTHTQGQNCQVKWLGYSCCFQKQLIWFPKWLYHFTFPAATDEYFSCSAKILGVCSVRWFFFSPKTLNFSFCTGVQPINNAEVVSAEQQRDSAVHVHVSILP